MHYTRKILYLSEYKNNIQRQNAGFVKLERTGSLLRLYFSFNQNCEMTQAYAYMNDKKSTLVPLGNLSRQGANYVLTTTEKADNIGDSGFGLEMVQEFIAMKDETHYCSQQPLRVERIETVEEKPDIEAAQEPKEMKEMKEMEEPEKLMEEPEKEAKNEEYWNIKMLQELPPMYPFEDDEMECCVRLEPKDFGMLPAKLWPIAKNSFLLEGYYTYRHIVLAKKKTQKKEEYYLGVPGVYHRRDCFMANMFGFPYFKGVHQKEDTMGDFGYWMKELEMR